MRKKQQKLKVIHILHFFSCSTLTWLWDMCWTHCTQYDSSRWVISLMQRPLPDNTQHSQEKTTSPIGFTPTIPISKWPQSHTLRLHGISRLGQHNQQTKSHLNMCTNHSSSTLYEVEKNALCKDHIHTIFPWSSISNQIVPQFFIKFSTELPQKMLVITLKFCENWCSGRHILFKSKFYCIFYIYQPISIKSGEGNVQKKTDCMIMSFV